MADETEKHHLEEEEEEEEEQDQLQGEDEEDEEEDEDEEKPLSGSRLSAALFGDEEEEDSSSDFEMEKYPAATEFDAYVLHRAAENGDATRLKEQIEKMGERSERRDTWGLTPLHTAIIACELECFKLLLEWPGTSIESKCQGSPVPHVILSVASISDNKDFGLAALKLLLEKQFNQLLTDSKDDYDRTPLRLTCDLGMELDFIRVLLGAYDAIPDVEARKQLLTYSDRIKMWNALHAAADLANPKRRVEVITELLNRGGFSDVVNSFDSCSRTCLHVLVKRTGVFSEADASCALLMNAGVNSSFKDALGRDAASYARNSAQKSRSRRGRTLIYSHETCSQHFTAPEEDTIKPYYSKKDVPPENVNRLLVLLNERFGTLRTRRIVEAADHDRNPPKAELGDVLRVHDWGYISHLKSKCEELPDGELGEIDGDTTFSKKTWEASLIACGSAIKAVDMVLEGKCENAFCAVRPPGHHAGPSGIVPDCTSHGFCFLNNIAIAAGYALDRHRDKVKRVAIIDFDVHHGNGTEVCVENLVPNANTASFKTPFGGELKMSLPQWKPWLGEKDAENVLFCSVHGFGKAIPGLNPDPALPPFLPSFYPGSGKNRGWREDNVLNVGQNSSSRFEWRQSWRSVVLPRLRAFKPDLLLISAGFDAHAKDTINGGFCGALEQDYEWLTHDLISIANECCEGRVVSVLEGGYRIQGMCVSAFARSVAEHVRVLAESDPSVMPDDHEYEWEKKELVVQMLAAKEMEQQARVARMAAANGDEGEQGDDDDDNEDEDEGGAEAGGGEEGDGEEGSDDEIPAEDDDTMEISQQKPVETSSQEQSSRPRRRAIKDISFAELNEQLNKERESKRQKSASDA